MAVGGPVSNEQSRNLVRKAEEKMALEELLVDDEDDEALFVADRSI
jgi:hypothetical protein